MTVEQAIKVIRKELENDESYYHAWQSNLAMIAYDEGVELDKANSAAKGFINRTFGLKG